MPKPHVLVLTLACIALVAGFAFWLQSGGATGGGAVSRGAAAPAVQPRGGSADSDLTPTPAWVDAGPSSAPVREGLVAQATAPAAEAQGGALHGRVVDAGGRPIAGARVLVASAGGFGPLPLDQVPEDSPLARGRSETRSAADGTFRIARPTGAGLRISVRSPGFAPLRSERGQAPPDGDLGDLALEAGAVLEGRVVDRGGRPVAGVEVHAPAGARGGGPLIVGFTLPGTRVGLTDGEGRFRLDELATGPFQLNFQHPRHPDRVHDGSVEAPGQVLAPLVVELADGHEVQGWVRGLEGVDPSTLRVRARGRLPEGSFDFSRMPRPRTVELGPGGAFVLGGLEPEQAVELAVVDASAGPFGGERSATLQSRAGARGLELRLREQSALTARVVDAATQEPIESFRIEAGGRWRAPLRDDKGRAVEHHPEGRVRFAPLETGGASRISVRIAAEGYEAFERSDLSLQPGRELDLGVIALQPAPVLEVRVVDASSGRPIEGANVRLAEWRREADRRAPFAGLRFETFEASSPTPVAGSGSERSARTLADGVARLTSLPGRTCTLTVSHPGYVEYEGEPFPLPAGAPEPVALALHRGGTVAVRVLDPDGNPVEGVAVERRAAEGDPGFSFGGPNATGSDGWVSFERLRPGVHGFRVGRASGPFGGGGVAFRAIGGGAQDTGPPFSDVTVQEGERVELILGAPARAALSGEVREGGRPLAGATLTLLPAGGADDPMAFVARQFGGAGQVRSGSDGRFAFPPQSLDRYRVEVTHPARAMPHEVEVALDAGGAVLRIDLPLTAISGRVTDGDGRPVAGATVGVGPAPRSGSRPAPRVGMALAVGGGGDVVSFPGGAQTSVRTDSAGRYELRGVRAREDLVVTVEAEGEWQVARSKPLLLEPDEVLTDVDLVRTRGGSLVASVLLADGSPAPMCMVTAEYAGKADPTPEPRRQVAMEAGPVRLEGLSPGLWRLRARNLGRGGERSESEALEVEVRPGEQRPVVLRLP